MFAANRYDFKYIILSMFLLMVPSLLFAAPIETVTNTSDAGAFEFGAIAAGAKNIPTLSLWGIITTALLLGFVMTYFYNKKRKNLV